MRGNFWDSIATDRLFVDTKVDTQGHVHQDQPVLLIGCSGVAGPACGRVEPTPCRVLAHETKPRRDESGPAGPSLTLARHIISPDIAAL
ncbi:hypothetical protein PCASD_10024 [Puccinia coronata f. sp. avenae]|uniref:Uncharacterized protein n=1 Tax=Puccinia coronata f. sp. avenae TaxID=200324 RepID=A0A2N5S8N2_9BASI|nr:hypothetical protein PCASD_20249 [Puccinia coronata f. sp. avenae]PLW37932.1 hypothetical protein PCASD_10024 [Puccinia coronata f. sp. avenae]